MRPPQQPRREIGFHTRPEDKGFQTTGKSPKPSGLLQRITPLMALDDEWGRVYDQKHDRHSGSWNHTACRPG
jgi:hypothetical protein